jgi:hypothetical protein
MLKRVILSTATTLHRLRRSTWAVLATDLLRMQPAAKVDAHIRTGQARKPEVSLNVEIFHRLVISSVHFNTA